MTESLILIGACSSPHISTSFAGRQVNPIRVRYSLTISLSVGQLRQKMEIEKRSTFFIL